MIFARRNQLPERVKVNKAGAISVLSFVRHLELSDNAEFDVEVVNNGVTKRLIFTATTRTTIEEPLNLVEANIPTTV